MIDHGPQNRMHHFMPKDRKARLIRDLRAEVDLSFLATEEAELIPARHFVHYGIVGSQDRDGARPFNRTANFPHGLVMPMSSAGRNWTIF